MSEDFGMKIMNNPILESNIKMTNEEYSYYLSYIKEFGVTLNEYTNFYSIKNQIDNHQYVIPFQHQIYDKLYHQNVIYLYQSRDMRKS